MAVAQNITIPDGVLPGTVLPAPSIDGSATKLTLRHANSSDWLDHEIELQVNGQAWYYDTQAGMANPIKLTDGQTIKVLVPGGIDRDVYVKGVTGAGNVVPMVNR